MLENDILGARDWAALFRSAAYELDADVELTQDVVGTLPAGLAGTFWRNGPGLFERGDAKDIHNIDADGMIVRVGIRADGRVFLRNRFVRTRGYVAEEAAGRLLERGVYGTTPPSWWLRGAFSPPRFKNTANTSLAFFGGRMLALWEGGHPHAIDPATLATLNGGEPDDLGGALPGGAMFTAHPRVCGATGRMVAFGVDPAGRHATLRCWEFEPDGFTLVARHSVRLRRRASLVHSFAVTRRWIVWVQDPVAMKLGPFVMGKGVDSWMVDGCAGDPGARTLIYVIPRGAPAADARSTKVQVNHTAHVYEAPAGFTYHHINAYETGGDGDGDGGGGGGDIVLDSVVYPGKPPLDLKDVRPGSNLAGGHTGRPGRLARFVLDAPAKGTFRVARAWHACHAPGRAMTVGQATSLAPTLFLGGAAPGAAATTVLEPASAPAAASLEMPITAPGLDARPHRFVYAVETGAGRRADGAVRWPWTGLVKVDLKTQRIEAWRAPPRCFLGEPAFAPRKAAGQSGGGSSAPAAAEDSGWLLVLCADQAERRTSLLVLDAQRLPGGPVARIPLPRDFVMPFSFHVCWQDRFHGPHDEVGATTAAPPASRL